MAVFDLGVDAHRLDFRLARTSAVTLFWRPALIDEATGRLRRQRYTIAAFDASTWACDGDLHRGHRRGARLPGLLRKEPRRAQRLPARLATALALRGADSAR